MVKLKTVNWTSGLIKKLLILSLLIITILPNISFAGRDAAPVTIPQTATTVRPAVSPAPPSVTKPYSTSSTYILGPSSREYLGPYAGFGVSMIPDSCSSYANIASDIQKITNLLSTQIKQMMEAYNGASCNTEINASSTCTKYIDTINNLTLTYATYQIEGVKQAKDKTLVCNSNNTRKVGTYNKSYYGIDITALTYASVRDAYVDNNFTDYATLLNKVNTNLVSKLNAAVVAGTFTDNVPYNAKMPAVVAPTDPGAPRVRVVSPARQYSLRVLALKTFKPISASSTAYIPRSRVIPPPPTAVLSNPNPFLFFGLTNNIADRTIGAIPFSSFQNYVNTFNADNTRLGDIYSVANRPLIDAGEAVLIKSIQETDKRLPKEQLVSPQEIVEATTTPVAENVTSSQKASVINSIGNWFGGVWGAITNFFGWMFGVEKAEAVVTVSKASGSGAGGVNYCEINAVRPKPEIMYAEDDSLRERGGFEGIWKGDFYMHNLFVASPNIKEVPFKFSTTFSPDKPVLKDGDARYLINKLYRDDNMNEIEDCNATPGQVDIKWLCSTEFKEVKIPRKSVTQAQNYYAVPSKYEAEGTGSVYPVSYPVSGPSSPYNCLVNLGLTQSNPGFEYYTKSVEITATANGQTATKVFDTSKFWASHDKKWDMELYMEKEEAANLIDLHFFNQKNKK